MPVFLEIADVFLDDDREVQLAIWTVISDLSMIHHGWLGNRTWQSEAALEEWRRAWLNDEMDGRRAHTPEERQAMVKRWKQWYADNVERKRKV